MKARLLVMHRKENYGGEYGPEILAVVDEYMLDENPQWWTDEIARRKDIMGGEASAWAEIEVDLDTKAVMEALYPTIKTFTPEVTKVG